MLHYCKLFPLFQVTGLIASTWNIPMFGFVGQSSKMDNRDIYDSYIKIVPPLKRSSEVLVKTLKFFGWSHVAMIGGGLESNTWDKVDALWKTVEAPLRDAFQLTAVVKFDTSNPELLSQNVKYISTVARGKLGHFRLFKSIFNHILFTTALPYLYILCFLLSCDPAVIVVLTNREDAMALLVEAERQGLMNGDYVFLLVQQFEVSGSVVSKSFKTYKQFNMGRFTGVCMMAVSFCVLFTSLYCFWRFIVCVFVAVCHWVVILRQLEITLHLFAFVLYHFLVVLLVFVVILWPFCFTLWTFYISSY